MARGLVDIKFLGIPKLQKKLKRLELAMQRKIVRRATRLVAKRVQGESRNLVPVSDRHVNGKHLRDTLKVRAARRSRGRIGHVVRTGTREELGIPKNAKGYYPAALEYGYMDRGGKKVPARSYVRRPVEERRAQLMNMLAAEIGRQLEIEARK